MRCLSVGQTLQAGQVAGATKEHRVQGSPVWAPTSPLTGAPAGEHQHCTPATLVRSLVASLQASGLLR